MRQDSHPRGHGTFSILRRGDNHQTPCRWETGGCRSSLLATQGTLTSHLLTSQETWGMGRGTAQVCTCEPRGRALHHRNEKTHTETQRTSKTRLGPGFAAPGLHAGVIILSNCLLGFSVKVPGDAATSCGQRRRLLLTTGCTAGGGRPPGDLERLRGPRGSEDRRGRCPWGPPPAHWNRPYGSALWKVEREMGSSRPQRSPLPSLHHAGRLSPAPHVQAGQFEPQTMMAIKPVRLGIICYTAIISATSQLRMAAQLDY